MRHFLLARELPAIFALCLVGAAFAFENQQSAWAIWLLFAALWTFLLWIILLPSLPCRRTAKGNHQHEHQQQQQRRQSKHRVKRCRAA